MQNHDLEYNRLLNLVLTEGRWKNNRTGIKTLGTFGAQAKFDLAKGFPLLTTKKVFFKAIVHELLWFISGDTNIKYLVDNDVHIWDAWAFTRYQKEKPKLGGILLADELLLTNQEKEILAGNPSVHSNAPTSSIKESIKRKQDKFIDRIKNDAKFASEWGELGEGTYGGMWRGFPFYASDDCKIDENISGQPAEQWFFGGVDQLKKIIDTLENDPDSRRIIVSAWHPYHVDHCALPPCHALFQFHTEELTESERLDLWQKKFTSINGSVPSYLPNFEGKNFTERFNKDNIPTRRLNCQLYQRSCDLFLGVPFNIASYALLTAMVAQSVGMTPGIFTHTYGDLHIYENHMEQVKLQLSREPMSPPTISLNPEVTDLFKFKYSDINLVGYQSHPAIKGEVAV